MAEKHLEACSLVDALELQLTRLAEGLRQAQALERNAAGATFGWGVVLSDEALENLSRNDQASAATMR